MDKLLFQRQDVSHILDIDIFTVLVWVELKLNSSLTLTSCLKYPFFFSEKLGYLISIETFLGNIHIAQFFICRMVTKNNNCK